MTERYYQVTTVCTGKSHGSKDTYTCFDTSTKRFDTLQDVKDYLKKIYGTCKRTPMYIDTQEGTKKAGYVYCFHNDDISHYPLQKWLQQDWVSIDLVHTVPALSMPVHKADKQEVTL